MKKVIEKSFENLEIDNDRKQVGIVVQLRLCPDLSQRLCHTASLWRHFPHIKSDRRFTERTGAHIVGSGVRMAGFTGA
jgi:hypothetical protein